MEITTRQDFEKLKTLPFFRGVISSDSMEPLLKVGEKIMVEVGNKELKRFDLIVFWGDKRLVCHYIWSMNRTVKPFLLQTRNLKYNGRDVPISWDDYLGKVQSHHLSGWHKFGILLRILFSRNP